MKFKNFAYLALLHNFNDITVFARLGEEAPSCPTGWDQVGQMNADIGGCGLENCDQRYSRNTIEECKSHCAQDNRCKSFTWAPLNGDRNHPGKAVCTIYDSNTWTQTWGPRQVMCKPTTPTIRSIFLSESAFCPSLYSRAPQMDGLNGDLNQSAGGKYIYFCLSFDENFGTPITALKLQQSPLCGSGWERSLQASSLNGDLNQSAGGKYIYLCYSRITSFGLPISNVNVRQYRPLESSMPLRPDGLNGDLNESAGGKDIFLELIRTVVETAQEGMNEFYTNNLLRNASGKNGDLSHWTIVKGSTAYNPIAVVNDDVSYFFYSYGWSKKQQLIDLSQEKIFEEHMDTIPPIRIYERFAKSWCDGDHYYLNVELLNAEMETIHTFNKEGSIIRKSDSPTCDHFHDYVDIDHTIQDYPKGVRFIRWTDGGQDSEYWAGHYGTILKDAYLGIAMRKYFENFADTPTRSDGDCAFIDTDGDWKVSHCQGITRYFACYDNKNNDWKVSSTPGAWINGQNQCEQDFGQLATFGVPMTKDSNDELTTKLTEEAWINYSDQVVEGRWDIWEIGAFENLLDNGMSEWGTLLGWKYVDQSQWSVIEYFGDSVFAVRQYDRTMPVDNTRVQTVDLINKGLSNFELDNRPTIHIHQSYLIQPSDTVNACIQIELLNYRDESLKTISSCLDYVTNRDEEPVIKLIEFSISEYPQGVYKIRWTDNINYAPSLLLDHATLKIDRHDISIIDRDSHVLSNTPTTSIEKVKITIDTGDNGTDDDVFLYIFGYREKLEKFFVDDFKANTSEDYEFEYNPPIVGEYGEEHTVLLKLKQSYWDCDTVLIDHIKISVNDVLVVDKVIRQTLRTSTYLNPFEYGNYDVFFTFQLPDDFFKKQQYVVKERDTGIKFTNMRIYQNDNYSEKTNNDAQISLLNPSGLYFKANRKKDSLILLAGKKEAATDNTETLNLQVDGTNLYPETDIKNLGTAWEELSKAESIFRKNTEHIFTDKEKEKNYRLYIYPETKKKMYLYDFQQNQMPIQKEKETSYSHTLRHEYGHKVMNMLSGMEPYINEKAKYGFKNGCGTHAIGTIIDEQCAFIEGWANFYSQVSQNDDPTVQRENFVYPSGGQIYLEEYSGSKQTSDAIKDEGRVAAALLDLWDARSDSKYGRSGYKDQNNGISLVKMFEALLYLKKLDKDKCTKILDMETKKSKPSCFTIRDYIRALKMTPGVKLTKEDCESLVYNYIYKPNEIDCV